MSVVLRWQPAAPCMRRADSPPGRRPWPGRKGWEDARRAPATSSRDHTSSIACVSKSGNLEHLGNTPEQAGVPTESDTGCAAGRGGSACQAKIMS